MRSVPHCISKYDALWRENPQQAKFGLFISYGLYSSLKANDA